MPILSTYYGDANLDGKVNAQDFDLLAANYGNFSKVWSQGDFNYDGLVNVADFNALAANFNATPLSSPAFGTLVPSGDDCIVGRSGHSATTPAALIGLSPGPLLQP